MIHARHVIVGDATAALHSYPNYLDPLTDHIRTVDMGYKLSLLNDAPATEFESTYRSCSHCDHICDREIASYKVDLQPTVFGTWDLGQETTRTAFIVDVASALLAFKKAKDPFYRVN
jgi:hypothetical protein